MHSHNSLSLFKFQTSWSAIHLCPPPEGSSASATSMRPLTSGVRRWAPLCPKNSDRSTMWGTCPSAKMMKFRLVVCSWVAHTCQWCLVHELHIHVNDVTVCLFILAHLSSSGGISIISFCIIIRQMVYTMVMHTVTSTVYTHQWSCTELPLSQSVNRKVNGHFILEDLWVHGH